MNLTKTPYLVLFILLGAIGVGTASALITITFEGLTVFKENAQFDKDVNIDGTITGAETLEGLVCSTEQVARWTGTEWACSTISTAQGSIIVNSPDNTGQFNSLKIVNGKPAISFYDGFPNDDLKFVQAANLDGTSWNTPVTVDSAGDTGQHTSLEIVISNPAISYYDVTNGDLRYVRAINPDGIFWPTPVTVDGGGRFSSLAIVNGKPAISYLGVGGLNYVQSIDVFGGGWNTPVAVDGSSFNIGYFTSLEIVNGKPAISYWDLTNDILKYVQASDADGTSWNLPVTVDSGGDRGTSLTVVNGKPAISYRSNFDLRYVQANNADGTIWNPPVTVDSFASTGGFSSLSIINGNPAISYQEDSNSDLRYVRANNADGTSWDAPIIVDSAGVNGAYTSLEIVNGKPAISYFDAQPNNDLRYVRAANADGTGWDFGIYFEN